LTPCTISRDSIGTRFGLIRGRDGLRIFGAGIVSSFGESRFALDDHAPNRIGFNLKRAMRTRYRIGFNLKRAMRTRYRIDDFQQTYFVMSATAANHTIWIGTPSWPNHAPILASAGLRVAPVWTRFCRCCRKPYSDSAARPIKLAILSRRMSYETAISSPGKIPSPLRVWRRR
jgi:hypothetical protein